MCRDSLQERIRLCRQTNACSQLASGFRWEVVDYPTAVPSPSMPRSVPWSRYRYCHEEVADPAELVRKWPERGIELLPCTWLPRVVLTGVGAQKDHDSKIIAPGKKHAEKRAKMHRG